MTNKKTIYVPGYASGIGGADPGSADGPLLLQKSLHFLALADAGVDIHWEAMIKPERHDHSSKLTLVARQSHQLAVITSRLSREKKFFIVLGGDHTSAIGTWSGAAYANKSNGSLGLIWIDAHMDSHTPQTSLTGNLHGMPLACLLGHGDISLTKILDDLPKFRPEHVCLIGTRSYEQGEADLLKKLNIKIFFMDEIKQRGLPAVFADAVKRVTTGTVGYGVSLDIDAIDPVDAPGTGVPEPDGIPAEELCQVLTTLVEDTRLVGAEIVEFDPHHDIHQRTEKLIPELMRAMICGKNN